MVATKKSFKKPHTESFKPRKPKEEACPKEKEPLRDRGKSAARQRAKNCDEEKKRKAKPATAAGTKRTVGGQAKSADKSAQQPKPKLLSRKKSQDITRQTVKRKEPRCIKNEIIRQYLAEKSERDSTTNGRDSIRHKREMSFDHNLKTNKLNVVRKNVPKSNQDTRAHIKVEDKPVSKAKRPLARSRDVSKAFHDSRRSSPSIHKGLSKSQKKLPLREKNLAKAKSMKQLRAKEPNPQGKKMQKITEKLSNKLDALDKKINVIFQKTTQKPKSSFNIKMNKVKKNESGKKKHTKRCAVNPEAREPKVVAQAAKQNKKLIEHNNEELINSLKAVTEGHLAKLTSLFEQYTMNNSNNANKEQLDNLAKLIENVKQTMFEYEKKIKEVPDKVVIKDEPPPLAGKEVTSDKKMNNVRLDSTFGHNRDRYNIAIEKPNAAHRITYQPKYNRADFDAAKRHNSFDHKSKHTLKTEELYSERSSALKKEQYVVESWRQPNSRMVKKHSKDLVLSNITKTKNSEEHAKSFERVKTSQAIVSNLENSEVNSIKEEALRHKSEQSEAEPNNRVTNTVPIVLSPTVKSKEDTKRSPVHCSDTKSNEAGKHQTTDNNARVANATEQIITTVIDDLFEDYLYRLFFLPDKITGIKTNYTYCRFYLETLMNRIQSKLTRPLQGESDRKPQYAFAAWNTDQNVSFQ